MNYELRQTMRDYNIELKNRIGFIQTVLAEAGAEGIVFGNSGGKDCVLVGILCKMACANTLGLIMPCGSKSNYREDMNDAETIAGLYKIDSKVVDLSLLKSAFTQLLEQSAAPSKAALDNIPPRLRMMTLYAVAASENRLVAGTGNKSERYMGYFTKWGDGAYDFNPIADLTVTEIYEFLKFLDVPQHIIDKTPSAGLYDGQTDESDMGVTYKKIDDYILNGVASEEDQAIINKYHRAGEHKRRMPLIYGG